MSGMSDGVSKVWIVRPDIGGGLEVQGFKSDEEAAVALARHRFWSDDWLERATAMRDAISREIRRERERQRRSGKFA